VSGETTFWDAVDALRAEQGRYAREAYGFVVGALGNTVRALPSERAADPKRRHLSGRELVAGIVELAHAEFGLLAPMVFREWGVLTGEDIGRIVFELVHCDQLSARPEDTMDDFREGPDLLAELARGADFGPRSSGESPGGGRPRPA